MKCQRHQHLPSSAQFARAFRLWGLALPACLLMLAATASAQEEDQEPPPAETQASPARARCAAAPDHGGHSGRNHPGCGCLGEGSAHRRDTGRHCPRRSIQHACAGWRLDGDGVPEMLLKWAIPDVTVGAEVAPAPDSRPLWGVYLLSWDGAHWKASRLVTGVEDFTPILINLGPPVGRGLAVVIQEGDSASPHTRPSFRSRTMRRRCFGTRRRTTAGTSPFSGPGEFPGPCGCARGDDRNRSSRPGVPPG